MLRIQSEVGPQFAHTTTSLVAGSYRSTIAVIACGWPVLRPA
jgi:hypothetical protein